jgi:hypothetical protein
MFHHIVHFSNQNYHFVWLWKLFIGQVRILSHEVWFKRINDCWAPAIERLMPIIPVTWEAEIRRTSIWDQFRELVPKTLSPHKITWAKWTRDTAQAVENLLCKNEALSSNSSPTKKAKQNEKQHKNPNKNNDYIMF